MYVWKCSQFDKTHVNCSVIDERYVGVCCINMCILWDRDCHGYKKTCKFEVTSLVGTSTVVNFSTLWHTAYLYHSITGISQVYYNKVSIILLFQNLFFLILNQYFCIVSHHDATKFSCASCTYFSASCLLPHFYHSYKSMQRVSITNHFSAL